MSDPRGADRGGSITDRPAVEAKLADSTRRERFAGWWRELGGSRRVGVAALVVVFGAVVGALANVLVPRVVDWFDGEPDPYVVFIERNPDEIEGEQGPIGGSYLFDRPLEDLGEPPVDDDSCVGRYKWARDRGGVDADATTVRVTVEATNADLVHVEGFDVKIVHAAAPPPAVHITCPGRGASPEVRSVSVLLDQRSEPEIKTTDEDGDPIRFLFEIPKGAAEIFDISALAPNCDCTWQASLRVRVGDDLREVVIDDGGKPFRTVSSLGARSYRWVSGEWFDEDTPATAPTPSEPATVENTAACGIATDAEVEEVLGMRFEVRPDFNTAGPGAAGVKVTDSLCSYVAEAGDSGLHTSLGVGLTTTAAADDAAEELLARAGGMNAGEAPVAVDGIGAEAYRVPGGVVARNELEIITIYAVAGDNRDRSAAVEQLIKAVAARRWR